MIQGVEKGAEHKNPEESPSGFLVYIELETLIFYNDIEQQCSRFLMRFSSPRIKPEKTLCWNDPRLDIACQINKRVKGAGQRSLKDVHGGRKKINPAEVCYSKGKRMLRNRKSSQIQELQMMELRK